MHVDMKQYNSYINNDNSYDRNMYSSTSHTVYYRGNIRLRGNDVLLNSPCDDKLY